MRQKVDGKIETFLNDYSISKSVTRDDASRLLTDIESDLEGNDTESTFITQECKKLRATHNLTESLFENVRDFDGFIEGSKLGKEKPLVTTYKDLRKSA